MPLLTLNQLHVQRKILICFRVMHNSLSHSCTILIINSQGIYAFEGNFSNPHTADHHIWIHIEGVCITTDFHTLPITIHDVIIQSTLHAHNHRILEHTRKRTYSRLGISRNRHSWINQALYHNITCCIQKMLHICILIKLILIMLFNSLLKLSQSIIRRAGILKKIPGSCSRSCHRKYSCGHNNTKFNASGQTYHNNHFLSGTS